jgi:CRISPR-associated protein Cas1
MIKRTLDISEGPTFLSIEDDQLVLSRNRREIARVPCEDVGVLLVDHQATTYTHSVFTRLISFGAVVVLCGTNHLPAGMLLSMEDNELTARRIRAQASAALPLRKRLWKQIVAAKIRGQAENLAADDPIRSRLLGYARRVQSADTSNMEGIASRFYWPAMMGKNFRRDPDGLPPNNLLNYGYAVMRAAVARAIVAAGLHPAFGLHHHNRNNTFALADDLVEVLRPPVDRAVKSIILDGKDVIDRAAKQRLLPLLTHEVQVADQRGPLMVQLHRVVASLVRCYAGEQKQLDLPVWPESGTGKRAGSPDEDDVIGGAEPGESNEKESKMGR